MKCSSLLTSNYHFYMQSAKFHVYHVLYWPPLFTVVHAQSMKSVMFKCTVLYWHPIRTFTCNLKFSSVLFSNRRPVIRLYMQSQIFKYSVLYWQRNYQYYMQSQIFKRTVLYWHPIRTFTCNLKFSSVMFATNVPGITFTCQSMKSDIQWALLHANTENFKLLGSPILGAVTCEGLKSEMFLGTYHFYSARPDIFKCNVRYLPSNGPCFAVSKVHVIWPVVYSVMFSNQQRNYHFYMLSEIFKCECSLLTASYNFYMPKYVIWNFHGESVKRGIRNSGITE